MRTDIEIARSVQKAPITNIAAQIGITDDCLHNYGKFIAKVPVNLIDEQRVKQSNLILVTAITPTKAGIGKTTVSVGLALGLNKIGKQAVPALREPSLGPCFGMKGGGSRWWLRTSVADGGHQSAFYGRFSCYYISTQHTYGSVGQLFVSE